MIWVQVIILILATASGVAYGIAHRRSFAPIAARQCTARLWARAFPDASAADLREFLRVFLTGFSLSEKHLLKFRPDDRLVDVYRALHPPKWTITDNFELEYFALLLEKRYGVTLKAILAEELTLGEVFAKTRRTSGVDKPL